ncbi:heme lyase CcmF/NrfE family subunit [Candidatus Pelagibacter sp.]|nr:heme lyase CcmF/NrfE family subunit [Candidatus Pelagibacter sp.]
MIISQLGFYSLIFGLLTSIFIFFDSSVHIKRNDTVISSKTTGLIGFQFFFVFISFISLIYSFIISDFSNETVYNNSHTTKPLFYKITGTWGNHEGSLLLWLLVLTGVLLGFIFKSRNEPSNYRLLTILFHQIIIIGFFVFVLKTSNPFNEIFPVQTEGLGLNPILQDPALGIHPPILYLGYVGTSIIFSAALASMISNYVNKSWAKNIKFWILFSWIFLTGGILLGSIWAYYELGWGGFWFWDPVENVSLMPWLSLTALLHCIVTLEKRELFKKWTIVLCIITFALSMVGTFLVRSGILNSVHTFANDPSRGIYILTFLLVLVLLSFVIFTIYENKNFIQKKEIFPLSKETAVLVNNWFILYFLSVVLIGTIYPIFLDVIMDEQISVGPPFYNKLILPFLIPFVLFMSIGPSMRWIKTNFKIGLKNFLIIFLTLIFSFITIYFIGKKNVFLLLLFVGFFYLLLKSLDQLRQRTKNFAQILSHSGFSLLLISILLNSFSSNETIKNIQVGESFVLKNEKIIFKKIAVEKEKNYESIIGFFEVLDEKNKIINLRPEIRIYNEPEMATSEASIKTTLFKDRFITINIIKDQNFFNVRYQQKPFMIWIWISTLIIMLGGLFAIFKKNKEFNI